MLSSLLWSDYLKTHSQTALCICCCICEVFMSISKRVSIFIVSLSVSFPYLNLVTASIFYLSPSNTTLSHLSALRLCNSVICVLTLPPLPPFHCPHPSEPMPHLFPSVLVHLYISAFSPAPFFLPLLCLFHSLLLFLLQMHFFHAQMETGLSHTPLCISWFLMRLSHFVIFWSPSLTPLLSPMYISPFLPLSASSSRGERLLCRVMAPSLPSLIEPEAKYRRAVKTEHL